MTFRLNRGQEQAASTLDRDIVVTAGAGSGKTRMLTERFINAIVPNRVEGWAPAQVDEIVAITFTDKAAGEIAERVRVALRDNGFVDEARRVDGAWVSTIHGLCSRLLRRHAFEAGVDPLFDVADTVAAGRLRADSFERVAVRLVEDDTDVSSLLDAYGYSRMFEAVNAVIRELAVRGLGVADIETEPIPTVDDVIRGAIDLFSEGLTACRDYQGSAKSPAAFADSCSNLLSKVHELRREVIDECQVVARLGSIIAGYKPLRSVSGLEDVRDVGQERGATLKGQVGALLVASHARGLLALVEAFSAEYESSKRRAGVLDFDDLQVGAVELLQREPSLAERYRSRFRLVMIDEFQDTDALQLRLVESLSRDDLCTVGDEKQSIYRFRGADIGVYREHRDRMRGRNALEVSLGVNYRSHPGILAFVNAVFSSDEYFAGDLLRLTPPEEGRQPQPLDAMLGDGPRAEAIFVDCGALDMAAGRRAEAREIALRLAALRDRGVDPGDMVILLRAYSSAHIYAEALTVENVPAIIVGGSRFFGLEEVAIMRALTRAIANPADGSALGELLASEFCPVSDDGLARLRLGPDGRDRRPLWTALTEEGRALGGDDGAAVGRLVSVVETARSAVGSRPLADVLLQAVEHAGYDLRLLARGNGGRDAFANVLKFARQAASFEAGEGTGPAGFSAYLDAKERYGDIEAPASVADDGSSAVRIMSVHASKGLEFPVVVVPDLASSGRGSSLVARTGVAPGRLLLAVAPPVVDDGTKLPESLWTAAFADAESTATAEERDRVLYVAFTRARDLLIASGSMNMRPKSTPTAKHDLIRLARLLGVDVPIAETGEGLAELTDAGTGELASCRVRIVEAEKVLAEAQDGTRRGDRATCALAPEADTGLASVSAGIAPPTRVSYSSMRRFEQCPRHYLMKDVLGLSAVEVAEPGVPDPTRFGSAVHAAMQLADREGLPPDCQRIAALGRQYELDAAQLERLLQAVGRLVSSPTAARAFGHERVAKEMPFALPIASGACVLEGNIDLYARTGPAALIIDYKSGTSGTASELPDRYELQARCYALAAFVDGCESVEVVFVRPEVVETDGGPQEIRYLFGAGDEAQLRATIESLYGRIAASEYEPLAARSDAICGYCAAPTGLCPNARP